MNIIDQELRDIGWLLLIILTALVLIAPQWVGPILLLLLGLSGLYGLCYLIFGSIMGEFRRPKKGVRK